MRPVFVLKKDRNLRQEILDAKPNDKIEYHVGFLALDRLCSESMTNKKDMENRATINEFARIVWEMWQIGLVMPVQKLVSKEPRLYSYSVVKMSENHKAPKTWCYVYPEGGKK